MADPISRGDVVECVDNKSRLFPGTEQKLRLGGLYTVTAVGDDSRGVPSLKLREVEAKYRREGFCADRFKPIYRPKPSLIDGLKAGAFLKNKEPELV